MKNNELTQYLKDILGEEYQSFITAEPEPKSIRVNTIKTDSNQIKNMFDKSGQLYEIIPFIPDRSGFIIKKDHIPFLSVPLLQHFPIIVLYQDLMRDIL